MSQKEFENIKTACMKALKIKYNGGVPDKVSKRLEEELGYLKGSESVEDFELQRRLFEEATKSSNLIQERGIMAGSFIYYLLGNSKVNPLPAHYYCPKCGHYEEVGSGIFGIDLPKEKCPECSETMISDGIDIPILSIWDKKTIRSFESSVSKGLFPYAKRLLEEMYPDNRIEICGIQMHYEKNNVFKQGGFYILPKGKTIDDYPDLITYLDDGTRCMAASVIEREERDLKRISLIPNSYLDCAIYMQNKTGIYYDEINLADIKDIIYRDICNTRLNDEKFNNLLNRNRPKSVKMISNLFAAAHNTYEINDDETIESLLQSETFKKCPLYTREDVYDYLVEHRIDEVTAFRYTEMVRKGLLYSYVNSLNARILERFKEVAETNVPKELYDSALICRYLFPRVKTVGNTYLFMTLAYYMKKDSKSYSYFIKGLKD